MADVEETPVEEDPVEETAVAPVEDVDEDFVAVGGVTEVKLFGKWAFDDIEIRDISLVVSIFSHCEGWHLHHIAALN
jgi:small subunit ribosomal protein S5e